MELLLLVALPVLVGLIGFELFAGDDDPQETAKSIDAGDGDDSLRGTSLDDQLIGNGGDDTLRGFDGDDTLRGSFGADRIDAGAGDDLVLGGADNDRLLGRLGNDTIDAGSGDDFALGYEGNDLIYLGEGDDLAWATSERSVDGFTLGQLGDDTIYGNAGDDFVYDYQGSNQIYGGLGDDLLNGFEDTLVGADRSQSDLIYGGAGNDALFGDFGDTLAGGGGDDSYVSFAQVVDNKETIIEGYNSAEDTLQIVVDPSIANATDWKLAASTNAETGDVSLFLENNATPSTVIDLAVLKAPTGFQLSQVELQFTVPTQP